MPRESAGFVRHGRKTNAQNLNPIPCGSTGGRSPVPLADHSTLPNLTE